VILAAGAGTRLGGVAKALLAGRDGRTFLASIVAIAREAGAGDAVVVVGPPFGDAVAAEAHEVGARVVVNPAPQRGMASSVALGFGALAGMPARAGAANREELDAAWLWPVDHPHVQVATLRRLSAALMHHDAARPVHAGRRGHPPLVARSLFARLAAGTDAPGGARSVLASADVIDVVVDDPGCVRDVDTPADLEAV
jgi:molybdenum cofactor cytidylyltransferase